MKIFKHRVISMLTALCMISLILAGCSSSGTTVMTVNGQKVGEEEYRYFFLSMKKNYESSNSEYFKGSDADSKLASLKEEVDNRVSLYYALLELAKKKNVKLDKEDEKQIDEMMKEHESSQGGKSDFDELLKKNYLTRDLYRKISLETTVLYGKVFVDTYSDQFLRAKHVLVNFEDHSKEEALAIANEVVTKARSGEDFDALVKQYGEDPGMENSPEGYYFTEGKMVDEFYQGTKALETDAVSEPIESQFGYHVIQRLAVDKDKLLKEVTSGGDISSYAGTDMLEEFDGMVTSEVSGLKIEYTSFYKKIKLDTFDS